MCIIKIHTDFDFSWDSISLKRLIQEHFANSPELPKFDMEPSMTSMEPDTLVVYLPKGSLMDFLSLFHAKVADDQGESLGISARQGQKFGLRAEEPQAAVENVASALQWASEITIYLHLNKPFEDLRSS